VARPSVVGSRRSLVPPGKKVAVVSTGKPTRGQGKPEAGVYEIRVKGKLSDNLVRELQASRSADSDTALTVEVRDRAGLHAFMTRIEDFGLTVISVNPGQTDAGDPDDE
jgi:hypothetical protein